MKTTCDSVIEWIGQADWGNVPTWVGAILTGPAVIIAGVQVWMSARQNRMAQRASEDSLRPVVVAYFEMNKTSEKWLDFVVKNVGQGAAYNVSFEFQEVPEMSDTSEDSKFWNANYLANGIGLIAPGQDFRCVTDHADLRGDADWPEGLLSVKITYWSVTNRKYEDPPISADMNYLKGTYQFVEKSRTTETRNIGRVRRVSGKNDPS